MEVIRNWFTQRFSDPQVLILTILLLIGFGIVIFLGGILAPLFAAVVIAYLLEGLVIRLEAVGIRRIVSVALVFLGFVALVIVLTFGVIPILSRQVTQFVQQLPTYISQAQSLLVTLPERYPELITEAQLNGMVVSLQEELAALGQKVVTSTLSSVGSVIAFIVFLVLVPVLVFFLMKDKALIMAYMRRYLPRDRHLATRVWDEVDGQIGNYVRGKVLEILIVGIVTFVTFSFLDLQYTILLATIVGFSVLIPYIGAAVATLPVAIVAFFQFGWSAEFGAVMIAYGIIQLLDGNALVPLLFSEVVNLHPVAIICAVLLFGGLWGFWGVFFAIPLATLFSAVLSALPDNGRRSESAEPTEADAEAA
ncbi:MAG: AI-2E family transporter [Pseudomonadota bacterium]